MKRRIFLAATAASLSGCGLSERPYTERRQWPLLVPRPAALPPKPRGKTLLVRTMRTGAGLERRGLQLLQPDGSLRVEFYEEWAVLPVDGVQDALRLWLAGSGLFSAVVNSGSREQADLVLESELLMLQADLGSNTARAALSVVLIDTRSTNARTRVQAMETGSTPLQGNDPSAYVSAQLAALADVLTQTERAIAPFA